MIRDGRLDDVRRAALRDDRIDYSPAESGLDTTPHDPRFGTNCALRGPRTDSRQISRRGDLDLPGTD